MAYVLGIDFDQDVLRGALIRTRLGRTEYVSFLEVPVEPLIDEGGADIGTESALRELTALCPRPPDSTIGCISGTAASLRVVDLPAIAAKKASAILPFELEALVPFALEDTVIDHQLVERTEAHLKLLAAAVPEDRLIDEIVRYEAAEIQLQEIAVGAAALDGLAALTPAIQGAAGPILIIEVRNTHTDLCALDGGKCVLARTFSEGAQQLATDSADFHHELQRTILGHRTRGGTEFAMVYVAGAPCESAEFVDWMRSLIDVPLEVIQLPSRTGSEEPTPARFARALALAGRTTARGKHINMRTGPHAPRRASGFLRSQAKLLIACTVSLVLALGLSLYADWHSAEADNARLQARLEQTTSALFGSGTRDPEEARALLLGGQELDDPLPRFTAFDGLAAVAQIIPQDEGHRLRSLEIEIGDSADEGEITLKGAFGEGGSTALSTIEEGLRNQECFREVRPATTRSGGQNKTNYELRAILRCPWQDTDQDDEGGNARSGS